MINSPYVLRSYGCFITSNNQLALLIEYVSQAKTVRNTVAVNNLESLLFWQIITREEPYKEYNNQFHFAREMLHGRKQDDGTVIFPVRPAIPSYFSEKYPRYKGLIQSCWQHNPEDCPENMRAIIEVLEDTNPNIISDSN